MLKDVSGGRDQKRLFLFLALLAVSETWLSLTLLAALIGVPQRQLGSILQKIEGTIIFLDNDHYHFFGTRKIQKLPKCRCNFFACRRLLSSSRPDKSGLLPKSPT